MSCSEAEFRAVAIVVYQDFCLFVQGEDSGDLWEPIATTVRPGEDLKTAVELAVWQSTGLDVNVIMPVQVRSGPFSSSVLFVCESNSPKVRLSERLSHYKWRLLVSLLNPEFDTVYQVQDWPLLVDTARSYRRSKSAGFLAFLHQPRGLLGWLKQLFSK